MYCLETWRRKGWGRVQGAGISDPLPRPWEASGKHPFPASHLAIGGVQGQGHGHSEHWAPEVPQFCCREIKVRPSGCRVGRTLPPTPQSLAFGLWVGCLFLNLHAPLEQMGEPVPMDGVDDIKHSELNEDRGQPLASPDSHSDCVHLRRGTVGPPPHRGTARQWTSGW